MIRGVLVLTAAVLWHGPGFATEAGESKDFVICEDRPFIRESGDYRARNSTEAYRWAYNDNWRGHTAAAIERVRRGDVGWKARGGLDWTLFRWPNHILALDAVIDYDLQGGRPYEFPEVECYLRRARLFAPDDIAVVLLEGKHFWKKGNLKRAEEAYLEAIAIDPNSADAHYNAGLFFESTGRYDRALEHAWAAYTAGYPLPGLRNKLEKSGRWRSAPAPATTETKSQ